MRFEKLVGRAEKLYESDIFKGMEDKVAKLHAKAKKEGSLKIGDKTFDFRFDGNNYIVTQNGEYLTTYNTRKLSDAKKWLIDYFNN